MGSVPWTLERTPQGASNSDYFYDCLTIPCGEDLESLPAEFQAIVTEPYRQAFRDPRGTLASLAGRAKLGGMRSWLDALLESNRCVLQLYRGSDWSEQAMAGFVTSGGKPSDFRLASGHPTAHLPPPLDNIYELIDGDGSPTKFSCGGLDSLPLGMDISSWGPFTGYQATSDLDRAIAFFPLGNGDAYFADQGRAILFEHETRVLTDEGDLHEFLDRFFLAKLKYASRAR
jgi:hypothetical protein